MESTQNRDEGGGGGRGGRNKAEDEGYKKLCVTVDIKVFCKKLPMLLIVGGGVKLRSKIPEAGEFLVADTQLHLAVSVGPSVRRSVGNISELRAIFALLLLPNRPRLDCRVSGLVLIDFSL